MRNEIIRFLESRPAKTGALFFTALGLELSVLARIQDNEGKADRACLAAIHEMQHCCFGQINAYLHGVDDLFAADASVAILYHYAFEAGIQDELGPAIIRARRLALQDNPLPSEDETRVLLVDDEPALRFEINRILTAAGMVVFEAETGAEGLNKAAWVEPHLTIVDWEMPVMNGPKFIETLRNTDTGMNTKVLLLVERGKRQPIGKAVKPLIDQIVKRPFSEDAFRNAVTDLLGTSAAPAPPQ
ncbi:MAG: response regulator [Planctomycetes bacterium]|nr:response regulator [Planctomycetota bacterium]